MKRLLSVTLIMLISVLLIGCGKDDKGDIIGSLGEQVEKVSKFDVNAVMEINDNNKKFVFDINVKYHKTSDGLELYKVTLKNQDSNNMQVILKNEEGVFVLNPTLNKSFKFQSDWPLNSSQPYLFQSIVKDIVNDKDAMFVKQGDDYVFETKVDYMKSKDLVKQKVIINGKTLFPKEVMVYDGQNNERIKVMFGDVNYKPEFKEGEFYVESTMSTVKEEYGDVIPVISTEKSTLYPTFLLEGTEIVDEGVVNNGTRTIMTFSGENPFTVVQDHAVYSEDLATELVTGDIVVLANGVAFVTNNSLTWYNEGLTLQIIAQTIDENMIQIANSMMVQGEQK
jgi:outer membrane lipoprotein-sorting protein